MNYNSIYSVTNVECKNKNRNVIMWFKKKNKNNPPVTEADNDYGAAELKSRYKRLFAQGFAFAVALHIVLIFGYFFVNYVIYSSQNKFNNEKYHPRILNVTLNDLPPPPAVEQQPPPPEVPKIKEMSKKDIQSLTPEPVAKKQAQEETIKTQKQLEQIQTPVSSLGDTGKFAYQGPVKVQNQKIEEKIKENKPKEEKTIFQAFEVEKPPEAVNLRQVQSSMSYPEVARQAGIQGRVTVKVLVGEEGSVIRVGSLTGPDVFYDEVRQQVMNLQFTPGLQNGKPVKVWVTVPFNFKLQN